MPGAIPLGRDDLKPSNPIRGVYDDALDQRRALLAGELALVGLAVVEEAHSPPPRHLAQKYAEPRWLATIPVRLDCASTAPEPAPVMITTCPLCG